MIVVRYYKEIDDLHFINKRNWMEKKINLEWGVVSHPILVKKEFEGRFPY